MYQQKSSSNKKAKKKNTIATNVTNTAFINCHSKKNRDCYIIHAVLLVILLLLIVTAIFHCYTKLKGIK